jgi:hypothetical protein
MIQPIHHHKTKIQLNELSRYVLINATQPHLAWSGSRWVDHVDGLPMTQFQICNFETIEEAINYAHQHHLEVVNITWHC